jgi:hypothetical protein
MVPRLLALLLIAFSAACGVKLDPLPPLPEEPAPRPSPAPSEGAPR